MPVIDIARALDISEVRTELLDGCEGTLLTDARRSRGAILVNTRHGERRARFSIAHELGHFLLERHLLHADAGFVCRSIDMRERRSAGQHQRQESEANAFAIGLLAPPKMMASALGVSPDLRRAQQLRDHLDVSLEAVVRRMVDLHDEPLAAIWSFRGTVRTLIRQRRFPWIALTKGDPLNAASQASRAVANGSRGFTEFREASPLAWLQDPDIEIFEQTRVGQDGHAVTLLWATVEDRDAEGYPAAKELPQPTFRRP